MTNVLTQDHFFSVLLSLTFDNQKPIGLTDAVRFFDFTVIRIPPFLGSNWSVVLVRVFATVATAPSMKQRTESRLSWD